MLLLLNANAERLTFSICPRARAASRSALLAPSAPDPRSASGLVAPGRRTHSTASTVSPAVNRWELVVDTARPELGAGDLVPEAGASYTLEGRSLALLRLLPDEPALRTAD